MVYEASGGVLAVAVRAEIRHLDCKGPMEWSALRWKWAELVNALPAFANTRDDWTWRKPARVHGIDTTQTWERLPRPLGTLAGRMGSNQMGGTVVGTYLVEVRP